MKTTLAKFEAEVTKKNLITEPWPKLLILVKKACTTVSSVTQVYLNNRNGFQ